MSTENQESQEPIEDKVVDSPEPEKKKAVSLADAYKIFKANNLTAFLDKDSEENFRKEIRKQAFAEYATPMDELIENYTGLKKDEGEKTKDFLARALETSKSESGSVEELKNTLEKKYKNNFEEQSKRFNDLKNAYDELNANYEGTVREYTQRENNRIVSDYLGNIEFIPNNKLADSAVRKQVVEEFFQEYEFAKTESGQMTVKKDGNIVFDPDAEVGTPIPLDKFFGDYIEDIEKSYGVSKKKSSRSNSPDISKGSQAASMKRWKEQIAEKALFGHEPEALRLKQKMGIPLLDHEKKALEYNGY